MTELLILGHCHLSGMDLWNAPQGAHDLFRDHGMIGEGILGDSLSPLDVAPAEIGFSTTTPMKGRHATARGVDRHPGHAVSRV